MAKAKHGDRIDADGDYYVEGLIPGRRYVLGVMIQSGTATMNAIGESLTPTSTVNTIYSPLDLATAITITATTPRAYEVRMAAPVFRFTIASASSLVAQLVAIPVGHGQ